MFRFESWKEDDVTDSETLASKLASVLGSVTHRAYLGRIALLEESATTPGLIVEANGGLDKGLYLALSEAARSHIKCGVFNVVPVPPGPWWEIIESRGMVVKRPATN